MNIVIATGRQAHYRLPANTLVRRGHSVAMYTSTPRSRMRGFAPEVRHRFVPAPVTLFNGLTHIQTPIWADELDATLFDTATSHVLEPCEALLGAASSSLITGTLVKQRGGSYLLDRACPDIRVQQAMMHEEARKVGGSFKANSARFIDRQVAEYEAADAILSPSRYSSRSFPPHIQSKVILCPLYVRSRVAPRKARRDGERFVVGVVGGHPLRKGYLYLLEAWRKLALSNSLLRIRSSANLREFPVIERLLADLPNVEIVGYLPDISAFYEGCDAYVLPSIDDGFGMALFEAIANGVPSIATRNCGSSELLEAERDFLLVDAFSVEQLADALLRLYESPALRLRLSTQGQASVASLAHEDSTVAYESGMDALLHRLKK